MTNRKEQPSSMVMNRVWAMPSKHTFTIKPIAALLKKYDVGEGWIDPFAGYNSPAEFTNDLNPDAPTDFHMEAKEFVEQFVGILAFHGGLFDPPYSLRQILECYKGFGKDNVDKKWATTKFYTNIKDILASLINLGGCCISFGWNSIGLGKKRGFGIVEILLVSHGRLHNDTIVTVERRLNNGT